MKRTSRRFFLSSGCVGAVALAFPRLGQAIEPITCLQAAAAVVGIVSGIAGMGSDASLKKSINEILGKLDVVIANQLAIIEDLRSLRIYIDEALLRSWRDAYSRAITSHKEILDVCFADLVANKWVLTPRLRSDFQDLSLDCSQATLSIGQMEIWAYPSFATGVAVVLLCERALGAKSERVKELKAKFLKPVETWLDPALPKSLPASIAALNGEIAARLAALNGRARSYVLRDQRVNEVTDGDTYCTSRVIDTLTVNGSFESGFSGAISTSVSEKRCRVVRDPCPRHCIVTADAGVADVEHRASRRMSLQGAALTVVVPGFTPSGIAIVDEFNTERVAIYKLMASSARQVALQDEMVKMRGVLS